MKIGELIAKVLKGEELTADEKKLLENYREPEDKSVELSKQQQQNEALQKQLEELQAKAEEKENAGLSEAQKLQKQLDAKDKQIAALTEKFNAASAEAAKLKRSGDIAAIAGQYKVLDKDYLDYRMQQQGVDPADEKAVKSFIEAMQKEAPNQFSAEVNTGGGGTPPAGPKETGSGSLEILLHKESLNPTEQLQAMEAAMAAKTTNNQ